jgi:hypothetical protein
VCYDFLPFEEFGKILQNIKRIDKQVSMMVCKFLKFVLLNTFKKKLVFQIDTGRVIKKRNEGSKIIWSIKDPFIKQINYGVEINKE